MSKGIKLTGMNELLVHLKDAQDLRPIRDCVTEHGKALQTKAQRNAPVDTGTLKRSITVRYSSDGLTTTVQPTVEYAPYVEWGTRFMNAQPYVKPAFDAEAPKFKKHLDKLMK